MRIAIVGPGGAGGYLGARLAEAGEDVVFIDGALLPQELRARGKVEFPEAPSRSGPPR